MLKKMNQESTGKIVFSKNVVEFVTVAVEYCLLLENIGEYQESETTDTLTKILPLLYLKTSLLPDINIEHEVFPEITVNEETYSYILSQVYAKYKVNDTYLEVFIDDMKYSETPISASISEDLADIYQDLKNFTSVYKLGIEENMYEALSNCQDNFRLYWGQKLVNVLRALHTIKYGSENQNSDLYEDSLTDNMEEEW